MAARRDGRIRMTVLGGYLGSGKTTWLRHQLHRGHFKDTLVILNEAADVPVDGTILGEVQSVLVLAGGCACCQTRGELVRKLREICDARSGLNSSEDRIQHIVLETSGLADPGAIVEAVKGDPVLVHHIIASEIIVVVDAINALDQLRGETLGRAQIEVADRLIVAKIDSARDTSALKRLLATLARLNPGATMSAAAHGSAVSLPEYEGAEPEPLAEPSQATSKSPILATTLVLDSAMDWTLFSVWLSALLHARGDDVLRVKGVARTPAGRLLLQSVRKVVQSPEILPDQNDRLDNVVVVIGRGYCAEDLRRSLQYFAVAERA
jgi:G3E family GTPase